MRFVLESQNFVNKMSWVPQTYIEIIIKTNWLTNLGKRYVKPDHSDSWAVGWNCYFLHDNCLAVESLNWSWQYKLSEKDLKINLVLAFIKHKQEKQLFQCLWCNVKFSCVTSAWALLIFTSVISELEKGTLSLTVVSHCVPWHKLSAFDLILSYWWSDVCLRETAGIQCLQ